MAQGTVKSKPKPAQTSKTSKHTSTGITKKGQLHFNPRKTKLQKQAKMNKKLTSGLTAQTERMLGEKAGHLELLGKGGKKKKTATDGGKGKK